MTTHPSESLNCGNLYKREASRVWGQPELRLYGEEFEVISDPFPEAASIEGFVEGADEGA